MNILRNICEDYAGIESAKTSAIMSRPQTLTEQLDSQIAFHEGKIKNLKEAKAAISPEVERALNALSKL